MKFKITLRLGVLCILLSLLYSNGWSKEKATITLKNHSETITNATTAACDLSFTTEAIGVFCNEETGLITVNITGGTAPFRIEWDNDGMSIWGEKVTSSRSFTVNYLPPGSYHIKVQDAYGCFLEKDQHLKGQVSTLELALNNNSSACDTEGSISVHVGNSSPPYWVIVDGPNGENGYLYYENNFAINGLPEGDYNITVRKEDCENTKSITVVNSDAPLAIDLSAVPTRSCDGNYGAVATNITGGHAPYRLYYDGATSGLTRSEGAKLVQNLRPGLYNFTVIDAEMCSVEKTIVVSGPSIPAVSVSTTVSVDACERTGAISVSPSGGVGNYILSWEGDLYRSTRIGSSGYTISDLAFGTYVISVEDEEGCTASETVEISSPIPPFSISVAANPGSCGIDGTISVNGVGGGSPYSIEWAGAASNAVSSPSGAYTIADAPAGAYMITVTDVYGCVRTQNVTLGSPGVSAYFEATANSGACGAKGSISVNGISGTGPYYVSWSGTASGSIGDIQDSEYVITDLAAGEYHIRLVDAAGCEHASSVTLEEGTAAVSFSVIAHDGYCGDRGYIEVTDIVGDAPYHISWTGGQAGSVTDVNATSYHIQDLPAGDYTVIVTDANGCKRSGNVTLKTYPPVTLATESSIDYCRQTGDIWVTSGGGSGKYTLTWSGNSEGTAEIGKDGYSIAGVLPGYYTVTIEDEFGCSASNSIEVSVTKPFLEYDVHATNAVNGANGSIAVTFGNGAEPHTVSWTGPVSNYVRTHGSKYDIVHLPPGKYSITVTDANGCYSTANVTVENTVVMNDLMFTTEITKQKGTTLGSIKVSFQSGDAPYTVSWTGTTSGYTRTNAPYYVIEHLPAGKYSITVTDKNGNYNVATVVVGYVSVPDLAISVTSSPSICGNNGTATVSISGGHPSYTISWTGNSAGHVVTKSPVYDISLATGYYTVTVQDAQGNTEQAEVTIGVANSTLYCSLHPVDAICETNGALKVIINGGAPAYQLRWEGPSSGAVTVNGDYTITDLPPGTYTIFVTDMDGCMVSESKDIGVAPSNLMASLVSGPGVVLVAFQSGTPDYTISTSGPVTKTVTASGNTTLEDLPAGLYRINIKDANGCTFSELVRVSKGYYQGQQSSRIATDVGFNTSALSLGLTEDNTLAVGQNYPNPFTGITTIPFELSADMDVTISIHDGFGKLIKQVQNTYGAGINQYELNSNELGGGVYYYTLSAGETIVTKRMIIIK